MIAKNRITVNKTDNEYAAPAELVEKYKNPRQFIMPFDVQPLEGKV